MMTPLVEAIRRHEVVLFVGAGVSRNLGLPSFGELVEHLAKELGYDPDLFATHGNYLALTEYYRIQKGGIGSLRSWMDRTWHKEDIDLGRSEVHKLIVRLKCPLIYTTNYDRWLERAHDLYGRPYAKIANVADLTKVKPGVTHIVKFHGDFDNDDESIVLTESSYFDRLDFESPLDLKLRADLLGKSVLFIGYSLSDINLRYMLYKLHRLWRASVHATTRPGSFVFLTRPNPIEESVWLSRGITSIVSESDDPGIGLRDFLLQLWKEAFGSRKK